jgi:hypothetical protein
MNDILEYLSKIHGKSKEELTEYLYEKDDKDELKLKDNSLELLSELDANRVATIKSNVETELTTKFEKIKKDQAGRLKKETLAELEGALMEDFSIESTDKKGIELVKDIIAKNSKKTLSADDIKKMPEYRELESRINTDYIPKTKYEELETEYRTFKTDLEKNKNRQVLREAALKCFRDCKPKLSSDANKAAGQERMFLQAHVDNLNVDASNPDDILLLKEDGSRMEDKHGNAITLKQYVKDQTLANFDIIVQNPGGGSGNRNEGGQEGSKLKEPENLDEFNKQRALLSGKDLIEYNNKYCEKFGVKVI